MLNSFCLSTLFNRQRQAHDWISSTRGADGLPDRDLYADHTNTHTHAHTCVREPQGSREKLFFYTPLYMQSHVTASCSLTGTTHLENNTFPGPVSRFDQRVVSQLAVNSSCPPVALSFCLKSSPSLSSLESTVCLLLLIESSVFVTLVTFGAFLIRLHDK